MERVIHPPTDISMQADHPVPLRLHLVLLQQTIGGFKLRNNSCWTTSLRLHFIYFLAKLKFSTSLPHFITPYLNLFLDRRTQLYFYSFLTSMAIFHYKCGPKRVWCQVKELLDLRQCFRLANFSRFHMNVDNVGKLREINCTLWQLLNRFPDFVDTLARVAVYKMWVVVYLNSYVWKIFISYGVIKPSLCVC